MRRIKIHGAGSIGNHVAHAARQLGWEVVVCDVSDAALDRMRSEIYPTRYGRWDSAIRLHNSTAAPEGGFDVIHIGTPPDSHLPLALRSLEERPGAILVEKPLCPPSLDLAQQFWERCRNSGTRVFVGYDHVVAKATRKAEELLASGAIGDLCTLDVEFREHWGGIFAAHPWLRGPQDSYLGFWNRGGGASGEHSHALNLWQHFAHFQGLGRVVEVDAMLSYVTRGEAQYDSLCLLNLRTEGGLTGRVVQDVVTLPPRKRSRLQGTEGAIEWVNGYDAEGDAVILLRPGSDGEVMRIPKTRPDDFIEELSHIESRLAGPPARSGLDLERGLDTALVLAAAHRSQQQRRRVAVDYTRGYALDALASGRQD